MRARWLVIWLTVSAVLNVCLLVGWLQALKPKPPAQRVIARRPVVTNILRPIRTNVVFAPRLLTWRDIESEDYPTYVRNLRAFGCPEPTVQDIIVADVNELFAARLAAEVPNPRREWWRSEPSPELVREAEERRVALEAERRELLTNLLGADWEARHGNSLPEPDANPLDGELLGAIPPDTRRQVREIERRHARKLEALRLAAREQDGAPSPAELARLERETRAELAVVLTPEQLEEYQLRYSASADRLRGQLRGFEATPDEFRALFRAQEQLAARLEDQSAALDDAEVKRLAVLAREHEAALERALGPARYAHYRLLQDPLFQQTKTLAERVGVEPDKLIPLYRVNQLVTEERQRVLSDTTLTPEDRSRELAELYTEHLNSLRQLVGEEAFLRLQAEGLP
jgi:hypothetical protein